MNESDADRLIVVYERVSSDSQDLERQATQRRHAATAYPDRGALVVQDDGVSAYKIRVFDRPGGKRLCDLIESGRVEAVFTDEQSRLSRGRQSEWWLFWDMCDANGTAIVIDGRQIDFENEGDEMRSGLDAMIARRESRMKSHRVKGGKRLSAERGHRNGGPRPFGYRHVADVDRDGRVIERRLEVVPEERAVVERIFVDYANGKSQAEIARDLNGSGVRTVRGRPWSQSRVGQTLRNELYVGKVHHLDDLFEGKHEPLVSAELFEQVALLRGTSARRGHAGGRPPVGSHLLTRGLLRCSCGAAMRARTDRKGYGVRETYLCDGRHSGCTACTQPAVLRELIDSATWAYFETVGVDRVAMIEEDARRRSLELSEVGRRIAEADRELAEADRRVARVERDYLADELSAANYERLIARCASERAAAASAVEQLTKRRQEIEDDPRLRDSEAEVTEALAAIRHALAGVVTGSADLPAARRALSRLFESFTLCRYDGTADVIDADLAGADWYLVPIVRADALLAPQVIGADVHGEPVVEVEQQLRRVPVDSGGKPSASPP